MNILSLNSVLGLGGVLREEGGGGRGLHNRTAISSLFLGILFLTNNNG